MIIPSFSTGKYSKHSSSESSWIPWNTQRIHTQRDGSYVLYKPEAISTQMNRPFVLCICVVCCAKVSTVILSFIKSSPFLKYPNYSSSNVSLSKVTQDTRSHYAIPDNVGLEDDLFSQVK